MVKKFYWKLHLGESEIFGTYAQDGNYGGTPNAGQFSGPTGGAEMERLSGSEREDVIEINLKWTKNLIFSVI